MKKILSHVQGLAALLLAVFLFDISGPLLRLLDPTAGTFDAGYIQAPVVALVYHLFLNAAIWITFQLSFPSLDKRLDEGMFGLWFDELLVKQKVHLIALILAFEALTYLFCLWLVPVS
jgi:hypothetical protein